MPPTDTCQHCRYAIPAHASICPGCGRHHARTPARLEAGAHPSSPLLRNAVWARRLLVATGWFGLALGVAGVARPIAAWDRVADELADDAALQLDHVGRLASLSAAICLGLAILATVLWTIRTQRHAVAIGVRRDPASPWSLPGWLLPGQEARLAKAGVDLLWRESSPLVGALPQRGDTRRLVSRVVLRWWSLWLWLPAGVALVVLTAHVDDGALGGDRAAVAVATGALLVATARAFYDVIGIVTVAHGHQEASTRAAIELYGRLSETSAASPASSPSSALSAASAPSATT
jgi:hypothetical protein